MVAQRRNEAPDDVAAQIDAKIAEIAEVEKQMASPQQRRRRRRDGRRRLSRRAVSRRRSGGRTLPESRASRAESQPHRAYSPAKAGAASTSARPRSASPSISNGTSSTARRSAKRRQNSTTGRPEHDVGDRAAGLGGGARDRPVAAARTGEHDPSRPARVLVAPGRERERQRLDRELGHRAHTRAPRPAPRPGPSADVMSWWCVHVSNARITSTDLSE